METIDSLCTRWVVETGEVNNEMASKNPLVSVGIPTYNRPESLRRTLESITGQTYKNLEIIVSDNCSPAPETEAVVREFIAKDKRIQYYRQEENEGIAFNWHFVLKKATGEYFMWVADDDYWNCDSVSILLREFEKSPESSVVMSACERVDEKNESYDKIYNFNSQLKINTASPFRLALDSAINHYWTYLICGLYRTKFLKNSIKNLPEVFGADVLFVCEVLMATKILYIDKILYFRQVHQKNTSLQYANEKVGKLYSDPLKYYKMIFALGPYLFRSKIIPWYNKLWIPCIVVYSTFFVLNSDTKKIVGHLLGFIAKQYSS